MWGAEECNDNIIYYTFILIHYATIVQCVSLAVTKRFFATKDAIGNLYCAGTTQAYNHNSTTCRGGRGDDCCICVEVVVHSFVMLLANLKTLTNAQ